MLLPRPPTACPVLFPFHFSQRNLLDAPLRQLAAERVAVATAAQASEYRDRAAERRVAFNQPDKAPSGGGSHGSSSSAAFQPKRKFVEGPAPEPAAPPPEPVLAPAEDASNVGNKLLAKMGWSQGQGLGLQGEGRVDPVETQLRAARAGLGAASRPSPAQGGAGRGGSYAQGAMDSVRRSLVLLRLRPLPPSPKSPGLRFDRDPFSQFRRATGLKGSSPFPDTAQARDRY
jgi:RNA-binding protein 5/10